MKSRLFLLSLVLPLTFGVQAHDPSINPPAPPAYNKDGSVVTGVLTATFNPAAGLAGVPIPNNLFFLGTGDLTLNASTAGLDPGTASLVNQINGLDGFSITEKWTTTFKGTTGGPGSINPASVVPGNSVRVFQVATTQIVGVTGIIRELTPNVDYVAVAAAGGVLAIVPLRPLAEYSAFMAVLTNGIKDTAGNDATPDQTYWLSKRRSPWVDSNGKSTYPLISDASAQTLEQLRQITLSMELAAATAGMNPDDIILAWTVQTQSITPTLKSMRSLVEPNPVIAAPTGLTTAQVGGLGLASISIGVISLPYYSGIPSEANPIAPLTEYWKAAPGAYVPPFDQFGLDPTSTHVTIANRFPLPTGIQTVPFMITVPSAASGFTKPAEGWPVVIYVHGITRNRTDMLTIADTVARAGHAFIAIDQPLHGVVPDVAPELAPFYIENTPFAPIANERTFDADYFNNTTGAPGPDGVKDSSGTSYFNLSNFRGVRDNLRQAQHDYSNLAASLQNISVDGDATPDLNSFNVSVLAHSLGVYTAVGFAAVEPIVSRAYFNAGGAQALRTIMAGSFGVRIDAALAALGIYPGTANYELFQIIGQTVIDSPDPAGWAAELSGKMPLLHNQVQGDDTVPNQVAGAPMGGNEGLNRLLGLQSFSSSQMNPDGLNHVARFSTGEHGSLIRFSTFPSATIEMHGQLASFFASGGAFVNVANPSVLVPVVDPMNRVIDQPASGAGKKGSKKGGQPPTAGIGEPSAPRFRVTNARESID